MTRICSDDKADENVSLCWCLAHRICSAIYPSIHAMESRRVSGQVADSFVRLQVSLLSGVLRATIPGACRTWQTSSRSNRLHSTLWASRWRQHCSCNPAAKDSCKWECVCFVLSLGSDRVVTWGHTDCGGDSSRVQDQLQTVQQICGRWNCGDLGRSTLWRWQLQSPRCAQLPLGAGRQKRPYRGGKPPGRLGPVGNHRKLLPLRPWRAQVYHLSDLISFGTPKFVIELRAHVPSFILGYLKYHRVRSKNWIPQKQSRVWPRWPRWPTYGSLILRPS